MHRCYSRPGRTKDVQASRASGDQTRTRREGEGAIRIAGIRRYSRKEILRLALRAAEATLARLQDVARGADPGDPRLRQFLAGLVAEAEDLARFIGQVEKAVTPPPVWRSNERSVDRILRKHFPSHRRPVDGRFADRDAALRFFDGAGQELSRFYYLVSDHVSHEGLSRFFRKVAQGVEFGFEAVRTEIP